MTWRWWGRAPPYLVCVETCVCGGEGTQGVSGCVVFTVLLSNSTLLRDVRTLFIAEFPGWQPELAFEGLVEGCLGVVAAALCNLADAEIALAQQAAGLVDAAAREVFHGRFADQRFEAQGKRRTRHADGGGQRFERPGVFGLFVQRAQRVADLACP